MKTTCRSASPYRSRRFLLSRAELAFFRVLSTVVAGRYLVFAKVRLADVITCPRALWHQAPGRRIAQKHLDFVLCDSYTLRFVLVIELDDRSHARPERRRRDVFLNRLFRQAGIPLLRQPARASYDRDELQALLSRSPEQSRCRTSGEFSRRKSKRPSARSRRSGEGW
jgi:hypothetical protein